jgi:phospholipid/cholesterol/gamma-HCH transport system substrate-binding protein
METRANHLLIGSFVLVLIAAIVGFALWLGKVRVDREFSYYRIYFDGAVTGLSRASDVRFNGVPVGAVSQIKVDPEDPQKVRVTVEVDPDTPIRTDTVAMLEWQGLTGASFVQLIGGSATAPMLVYEPGKRPPVIQSRRSAVQELFSGMPDLMVRVMGIAERVSTLLDDDNRAALAAVLHNAERLTAGLAGKTDAVGSMVDNLNAAGVSFNQTAAAARELVDRLDRLADNADRALDSVGGSLGKLDRMADSDVAPLLRELRQSAKAFAQVSGDLRQLLADNREAVNDFSGAGLNELTRFIGEARQLVNSIDRLSQRIESDPSQFLFGDAQRGYKPR